MAAKKHLFLLSVIASLLCIFKLHADEVKTIIFTGDSISCGVGASAPQHRFTTVTVDLLNQNAGKKLFAEKNIAVSGSTMVDQLWPNPTASGYPHRKNDVLKHKPDILVIQHGVNDNGCRMSLGAFAWSYRQFVREVKAALPQTVIVCLTITPTNPNPARQQWICQANAAIQEIAALENVLLAQINLAFDHQIKKYFPDSLHPNDAGHRLIAETVAKTIENNQKKSKNSFDFVMRAAGEYSVCEWVFNISQEAADGGFSYFRNVGKDSFEYCSYGKITLATPLKYYPDEVESKSLDPQVTPEFSWHNYQRRGNWKLPSTNGKWVKIVTAPPKAADIITDFTSLDTLKKEWNIVAHPKFNKFSVADGIFTLDTHTPRKEVRLFSRRKFKYAKLEAKVKFSELGKGFYAYTGFVTTQPWHSNAVWLMNCNTANGTLYVTANKKANKNSSAVRSGNLVPGQWHDLIIDRSPDGAALYVDGKLQGKVTDKTILPDTEMPIMFILNSPEKSMSIQIKELKVTVYDENDQKIQADKKKNLIVLEEDFRKFQVQPSLVTLEDHSENNRWTLSGPKDGNSNHNGVLNLGVNVPNKEVRLVSKDKFLYGKLDAEIKFDHLGRDLYSYIGFVSLSPWVWDAAWLMNCNSANGTLHATREHVATPASTSLRSGDIAPGQWHKLSIDWKPEYIELAIDGKVCGRITDKKIIPQTGLNAVFIISTRNDQKQNLQIRNVRIEAQRPPRTEVKPPKPVKVNIPKAITPKYDTSKLQNINPSIAVSGKNALLKNRFYEYKLNWDNGLKITSLVNNFTDGNILHQASRVLVFYHRGKALPNEKLTVVNTEKNDDKLIFTLKPENIPAKVELSLHNTDSAELKISAKIINTSDSDLTAAITCPVLENIKIGDNFADNLYFYPSESGLAGGIDIEMKQTYGFVLFMQIMNFYNPKSGGGVYAFPLDATGMPKVMTLRKKTQPGAIKNSYQIIPWGEDEHSQNPGDIFGGQSGCAMSFFNLEFTLSPGANAAIPDSVIGVHAGDWHDPLRRYSEFVHSWYKKPNPTPRWYMDTYGYLSSHPASGMHFLSTPPANYKRGGFWDSKQQKYIYSDLMGEKEKHQLQELAFWWDYKELIPDMKVADFSRLGLGFIDGTNLGDYRYNSARGGLEKFKDEISKIHAKEGRLLLYTYPDGCAATSELYQKYGMQWARMSLPGRYSHNYTSPGKGVNLCQFIPRFGTHFGDLFGRIVHETGADGVRLDVCASMKPCFNPAHDHFDGSIRSTVSPEIFGKALLDIQSAVREKSPQAIVSTEHAGCDYLTQYTDGFLSQCLAWHSDTSPRWAPYRALNTYKLVFTRFYFPEVKVWIHGPANADEAIKMSLFNAVGIAIIRPNGVDTAETLRENGDALNSGITPEPYIPTLLNQLYANSFPGKDKHVWTLFNRSGKTITEPVLEVEYMPGYHYVEMSNDLNVAVQHKNGKTIMTLNMPDDSVALIARIPEIIQADLNNGTLQISVPEKYRKLKLQLICGQDIPENRQELDCSSGKLSVPVKAGSKLIIKLIDGYYVKDQVIIEKE